MTSHFFERIMYSTVRLSTVDSKSGKESIGTGFLVGYPIPGESSSTVMFLVSNRHVLDTPDHILRFTLHVADKTGKLQLGNTHSFSSRHYHKSLIVHPNPNVDIACFNFSDVYNQGISIFSKFINYSMVSNLESDELYPGNDIYFMGYPQNRFDEKHNLPLLRKGITSSHPRVDYNGERVFIVDAQVFPGSSGSPVFSIVSNKYHLIGAINATMIINGRLKIMPTYIDDVVVEQTIGLGIVTKSTCIKEVLDIAIQKVNI